MDKDVILYILLYIIYVILYTYVYIYIIQPSKKKEILPLVTTWVDLGVSQTEKDKYCMTFLIRAI